MPGRAGHRTLVLVDGEIIEGKPAGHGGLQRLGLDHGVVPGVPAGGPGLAAAVGRVAVHLQPLTACGRRLVRVPGARRIAAAGGTGGLAGPRLPRAAAGLLCRRRAGTGRSGLATVRAVRAVSPGAGSGGCPGPAAVKTVTGSHLHPVLRVAAALPGRHGHLAVGDQPGLRLGGHVPAEPVPALGLALAGMPGLRVDGADHAVRSDFPGDPPPPVGAVRVFCGLHVLPGDQRQQPQRVRRRVLTLRRIRAGQLGQHRQRVVHQVRHQLLPGRRVVPVDVRLARLGVVPPAHPGDHLAGPGHHPRHLADRRHQLGDRVLGGHRVVEHRRIHAPLAPPAQDPRLGDHLRDRVEHPVRPVRGGDPPAPVDQRGRVEAHLQQRPAAGHLPPDVILQRVRGLRVGQVIQLLEHQHAPDQAGRQRWPAGRRGEQVGDELIGEQLRAVRGQEREHAARLDQVPGHIARVPKITIAA